jgi:hypothetical protein
MFTDPEKLHRVTPMPARIEELIAEIREMGGGRHASLAITHLEDARFRLKEEWREIGGRIQAAKGSPYDEE